MSGPVPFPHSEPRTPDDERCIQVASDRDIVVARQHARSLALKVGFSASEATIIATAVSELARNIVHYAVQGNVTLASLERGSRRGLIVIAEDGGPGIADIEMAMRDGFSTAGRLGLGLPGVRRLMDEFEIDSEPGKGTRVTTTKWTS